MARVDLRGYKPGKIINNNVLYRIEENTDIELIEVDKGKKPRDIVHMEYCLNEGQYGIYAYEYKRPGMEKDGCKAADVLMCIVDDVQHEIKSLVYDVKHDISAFSDDLLKPNAMTIALGEVSDFIKQIQDELLHKDSFMIYYKADGYEETENIGLVTSSFEEDKFRAVAGMLETLLKEDNPKVSGLISFKLKNNLKSYANAVTMLDDFADLKIVIGSKSYDLNVYILQKVNETDYEVTVTLSI